MHKFCACFIQKHDFENLYSVALKQILVITGVFKLLWTNELCFFCAWPQQTSLSLQTEMNQTQTSSGCSDIVPPTPVLNRFYTKQMSFILERKS